MADRQIMERGNTVEMVVEFSRHRWEAGRAIKEEIDEQVGRVLCFLRKGFKVDQWDALHLLDVGRLSARIYEIRRRGLLADDETIKSPDDYDGYKPYYLSQESDTDKE